MGINVNIAEAKARLSELVSAAVRGEEIVLARAGKPQVRLVAIEQVPSEKELAERLAKRRSALGMWKKEFEGWDTIVPPSMTDKEIEERWQRKFGPAA